MKESSSTAGSGTSSSSTSVPLARTSHSMTEMPMQRCKAKSRRSGVDTRYAFRPGVCMHALTDAYRRLFIVDQAAAMHMSASCTALDCQAGKQRDFGSNLLRFSFLFKSCGLWTLSNCDFVPHNYETLKWLSSQPTLMQESF